MAEGTEIISDVGSSVGQSAKDIATNTLSKAGSYITILIWILLFAIIAGVIAYYILNVMKYNKRIIIYENISGRGYVPTRKDRAMVVKISNAGEEILYLQKHKVYKPSYGQKIGKNTYGFAIGDDGYWYNITFSDLEKERGQLKLHVVDKDMRYTHEGIRKNVQANFEKKNWLKENIGLIVGIMSVILVLIFMWLLADKYFTIFSTAREVLDAVSAGSEKILGRQAELMQALDNICSGGADFRVAG